MLLIQCSHARQQHRARPLSVQFTPRCEFGIFPFSTSLRHQAHLRAHGEGYHRGVRVNRQSGTTSPGCARACSTRWKLKGCVPWRSNRRRRRWPTPPSTKPRTTTDSSSPGRGRCRGGDAHRQRCDMPKTNLNIKVDRSVYIYEDDGPSEDDVTSNLSMALHARAGP